MTRKPVFDAFRTFMGGKLTQAEADAMDALLDRFRPRDAQSEWLALAVPLIAEFEGFRERAYPDPGTGGKPWTIGFGSTRDEHGQPIKPGTVWTRARAEARFRRDVQEFAEHVDRIIDGAPTTPNQKAAMVSLAYNVGPANLATSTLLRLHKVGDYAGAANEFARWKFAAGKVLPGLVRRRAAEAKLYRGDA